MKRLFLSWAFWWICLCKFKVESQPYSLLAFSPITLPSYQCGCQHESFRKREREKLLCLIKLEKLRGTVMAKWKESRGRRIRERGKGLFILWWDFPTIPPKLKQIQLKSPKSGMSGFLEKTSKETEFCLWKNLRRNIQGIRRPSWSSKCKSLSSISF